MLPDDLRLPIVAALKGTGLEVSGTVQQAVKPGTIVTLKKQWKVDLKAVLHSLSLNIQHDLLLYRPMRPWDNSCRITQDGKIILYCEGVTPEGWTKFGSDYSAEELDKIISVLPSGLLEPIVQSLKDTDLPLPLSQKKISDVEARSKIVNKLNEKKTSIPCKTDVTEHQYVFEYQVGFTDSQSNKPILLSSNAVTFIIMIVYNADTKTTALSHIHMATDLESVNSLFKALRKNEEEPLKVYLAGAIEYTEDICRTLNKGQDHVLPNFLQTALSVDKKCLIHSSEVVSMTTGAKNVVIEHVDLRSDDGQDRSLGIDTRNGELFTVPLNLIGEPNKFLKLSLNNLEFQGIKEINDIIAMGVQALANGSTIPLFLAFDGRSEANGKGNFRSGMHSDVPSKVTEVKADSVEKMMESCSLR